MTSLPLETPVHSQIGTCCLEFESGVGLEGWIARDLLLGNVVLGKFSDLSKPTDDPIGRMCDPPGRSLSYPRRCWRVGHDTINVSDLCFGFKRMDVLKNLNVRRLILDFSVLQVHTTTRCLWKD